MGYDIERMKEGKKNVMNAISGTKGGREKKKKKFESTRMYVGCTLQKEREERRGEKRKRKELQE